jgi:hypothetical protein
VSTEGERVTVLVDLVPDYRSRIPEVVSKLERAGFRLLGEPLPKLGVLRGTVVLEQEASLRHVEGVAHVRREGRFTALAPETPPGAVAAEVADPGAPN